MNESVKVSVRDAVAATVRVRGHTFRVGEPVDKGGTDDGPTPMETFLGGLASCVAITLRMYANLKGLPVREIRVRADQARTARGEIDPEEIEEGDDREEIPRVDLAIEIDGDVTDEQLDRLRHIAKRCPVHRVVTEHPIVHETLVRA
jgi:putative redox protein